MNKQGNENVQHKDTIPVDDLKKLKARRGREGQGNLKPSSFKFAVDEQGKRYVTMTHYETSKNHPGGLKDKSSFEKTALMYETDSDTDGYRALSLYISKLNLKCKKSFTASCTKTVLLVLTLSAV